MGSMDNCAQSPFENTCRVLQNSKIKMEDFKRSESNWIKEFSMDVNQNWANGFVVETSPHLETTPYSKSKHIPNLRERLYHQRIPMTFHAEEKSPNCTEDLSVAADQLLQSIDKFDLKLKNSKFIKYIESLSHYENQIPSNIRSAQWEESFEPSPGQITDTTGNLNEHFDRLMNIDSCSESDFANLAEFYFCAGDLENCLAHLRLISGKNVINACRLASILISTTKIQEADDLLASQLSSLPDCELSGAVKSRFVPVNETKNYWNNLSKLWNSLHSSNDILDQYRFSILFRISGEWDKAAEALEIYLHKCPKDIVAIDSLSSIYKDLKRDAESIFWKSKLLEIFPDFRSNVQGGA